jgi:hypothetical protein
VTQPGPGDQQPRAHGAATSNGGDLIGDLPSQIAESGRQITDKENQIKALEHEVTQLKSGNASLTAFHQELKASVSALGQAQNEAATERDDARKLLPLAKEIEGRLAADHVRAIDRAVDAVEAESEERTAPDRDRPAPFGARRRGRRGDRRQGRGLGRQRGAR